MAKTSTSGSDSGTTATKSKTTKSSVRFKGSSLIIRRMTKADWKRAGLDEDEAKAVGDVEWSSDNDHTVDSTDWPDKAFDVLAKDTDFKVDGREKGDPENLAGDDA